MFNGKVFIEAIEELSKTKGIDKDSILKAIKEAMEKGYSKQLGGNGAGVLCDALVNVNIDPEKNLITMCQQKKVVATEDDITDDFIEISLDEAKQKYPDIQVGDMYDIPASVDDLSKIATNTIKSVLRQKINEAEKAVLYATFKDKIGEMITGVVEKSDDWSTSVNIGRTSVSLSRREKIGNETFRPGDTIKLYVKSVDEDVKGTKILVSRADPNFLKRLMEEEIHEIYEGTVVIKAIAREAGDRSKVAVTTSDPNIDPTGACIGPNGSRIQRVVSQLGNGSSKEKIDVILWNENVGVMLSEALKPSTVIGLKFVEGEDRRVIAVVNDDQLSLAIGKGGANARLAVKLTGYNIDIKIESKAKEEGIDYTPIEEFFKQAAEEAKVREHEKAIAALRKEMKAKPVEQPVEPATEVAPASEVTDVEPKVDVVTEVKEEVVAPVEEVVEKPVEEKKVEVKITKSLDELEASLSKEKEEVKKTPYKKVFKKKPMKIEDDIFTGNAVEEDDDKKPVTKMDIYTKEELEEMAKEENMDEEIDEEDVNYEDYDSYYDDDDSNK